MREKSDSPTRAVRSPTSGRLVPYFQAKIVWKDDTELALSFGIRF